MAKNGSNHNSKTTAFFDMNIKYHKIQRVQFPPLRTLLKQMQVQAVSN